VHRSPPNLAWHSRDRRSCQKAKSRGLLPAPLDQRSLRFPRARYSVMTSIESAAMAMMAIMASATKIMVTPCFAVTRLAQRARSPLADLQSTSFELGASNRRASIGELRIGDLRIRAVS